MIRPQAATPGGGVVAWAFYIDTSRFKIVDERLPAQSRLSIVLRLVAAAVQGSLSLKIPFFQLSVRVSTQANEWHGRCTGRDIKQ